MAKMIAKERVLDNANITGTGEYTVTGASTGFQPLSVIGANNYFPGYVTDGINWEAGLYTYVSGPNRAQRTHIVASSNGGAAVNWNNANVQIRCGFPAWLSLPRQVSKSVAGASNVTLTALEQRCHQLILTGVLTGNINVIVDETEWQWEVYNNTSGAFTVTVKTAAGSGIVVAQGKRAILLCDGINVVAALTDLSGIDGAQFVQPGTIVDFAGTAVPSGYLQCNGANVSRTTYAALFAAIGTTWGAGDGSTTFTLPDFRRRVAVGSGGTGTGTLGNSVGNTGGSETHTLSVGEMPSHNHGGITGGSSQAMFINVTSAQDINDIGPSADNAAVSSDHTHTISSQGGGGAHNNLQPSAVVLKIIKT